MVIRRSHGSFPTHILQYNVQPNIYPTTVTYKNPHDNKTSPTS